MVALASANEKKVCLRGRRKMQDRARRVAAVPEEHRRHNGEMPVCRSYG